MNLFFKIHIPRAAHYGKRNKRHNRHPPDFDLVEARVAGHIRQWLRHQPWIWYDEPLLQ